ncbi:MAG: lipoyl synthase [Actinobacteria bacterium]|nr:MAG: lipoyl synthase [Actinomycetota bacterium]
MAYEHGASAKRMPEWMKRPIAREGSYDSVKELMERLELHTVCQSAKCPNQGECFASGTATFLIMGDACTRGCRFCAVDTRQPAPLDPEEPSRLAEAVLALRIKHAVITTVTRDDLPDGGAAHFVAVIEAVRGVSPGTRIEVLTSDFGGRFESVDTVADALPDVFNHNLETVPRLYAEVRPGAVYERSLAVLERVKSRHPEMPTKSGLMLGLGETHDEVVAVMRDLRASGCDMITLGQYLRPSAKHLPVAEFVTPGEFEALAAEAETLGFCAVASAPFVRSSYHAGEMAERG